MKIKRWFDSWKPSQITFLLIIATFCLSVALYATHRFNEALKSARYWEQRAKLVVATLMCVSLLAQPVLADSGNHPKKDSPEAVIAPVVLGLLLLTVAAVGVYCVISVSQKIPANNGTVTVILEKSKDHSTWIPISTNTVTLNGQTPIELLRDQMTDSCAFYRARTI